MPKLKLDLDALTVDTFDTTPAAHAGGNVVANQQATMATCPGICGTQTNQPSCLTCIVQTCGIFSCQHLTCHATCPPTCQATCQQSCQGTCQMTCPNTCQQTCNITCNGSCAPTCVQSCVTCETCMTICGGMTCICGQTNYMSCAQTCQMC